jgi:hypothetical protein
MWGHDDEGNPPTGKASSPIKLEEEFTMRFGFAVIAVASALPLMLGACTAQHRQANDKDPTAVAEELKALSRLRHDAGARGDREAYARGTADEFIATDDEGTTRNRKAILSGFGPASQSPLQDTLGEATDIQISDLGDTAILNYRTTERELFSDSVIVTSQRRSEVYVWRDHRWQLVLAQTTPIAENHRKTVLVDPSVYDAYVGTYEWFPGKVDVITRQGNKLISKLTGYAEDELFPVSPTTFIEEDDLGEQTFVRDESGRVIYYTYRRSDGQELKAARIK